MFGNLTNHMRWIAHGYDVLRNVTCHHGPGADDGIRPDGHPRRDRHIGAEPHVITDGHGTGMLPARQAAWVLSGETEPPAWQLTIDGVETGEPTEAVYEAYAKARG